MPYQFIDGYGSVLSADSSIISGSIQRPVIQIGSVLSTIPVVFSGNTSVSGTVGASIIGAVNINPASVSGTVGASVIGTVPIVQSGTIISSLVSTIPSSVQVGASIIGSVPITGNVGQTGIVISSVVSSTPSSLLVGASIIGLTPISGNVGQTGTIISSIVSTIPSSVIVGTSIFGQLPAGTAPIGSVAVLQGTNPWIGTFSNSSILAVPVGSTIAVLQGASIVGTYAEDAAHTTAAKGLFILGVRNDAVSSITSAESDYSPVAVDDVGRNIIVPFAGQQACIISYVGSVVSASVTLIRASVIGSRSYITDFLVANTGAATELITFQGGDTSVLGYTIAPASGGSNAPGIAIPLRTTLSQDLAFKATGASSVVYVTVKGYQAP